jgi:hypothetical protein
MVSLSMSRHRPGRFRRFNPKRMLISSGLAVLLFWLAVQIMLNVAARDLSRKETADAPTWIPVSSAVLVALADRRFSEAEGAVNWSEVERAAGRALSVNPLEHRALFFLALAAESRGDNEHAAALLRLAGQRTLREPLIHLWLFHRELAEGDVGQALHHADVVMRSRHRDLLAEALIALASHPAGFDALVAMLDTNPRWRSRFLRDLADRADPSAIFAALQQGSHPPRQSELRAYLDLLIRNGRYEQAFFIWRGFLPASQQDDFRYLFNGDFAYEVSGAAFDWLIAPVRGADARVVDAPSGSGRGLRIDFARGRIDSRHASKLLMLPPGTYRLSGQAEAQGFGNSRGLEWRLSCADGDRQRLMTTEPLTGTVSRHAFSETFTVPSAGCRAQWLVLELAARVALEREVTGGTVWYDSLEVERLASLPAS